MKSVKELFTRIVMNLKKRWVSTVSTNEVWFFISSTHFYNKSAVCIGRTTDDRLGFVFLKEHITDTRPGVIILPEDIRTYLYFEDMSELGIYTFTATPRTDNVP